MNEVMEQPAGQIEAYNPFRAQLAELKAHNDTLVFSYSDPKGNKEARSHVYKLRQTRSAVDKVREAEKAESLRRGRMIDAEAKDIMAQITEMIDVHQKPLDEIDRKEKDRIVALQAKTDALIDAANIPAGLPISALEIRLKQVMDVVVDASFDEFMAPATTAKEKAMAVLTAAIDAARKQEAEKAELERLRAELAARLQLEREQRIAQEAAEKAKLETEAKAKTAADEAARRGREMMEAAAKRERDLAAQAEKAKQEAAAAQERAARAAQEAEHRVRLETAAKAAQEAAEQAKREANKNHKARVNREARDALVRESAGSFALSEETATMIVTLIVSGKIPRVSIYY